MLVEGLDFELAGGSALAVTGRNGAGKSTLLRAIAGFLPPAAGEVRLDRPGQTGAEDDAPGRAAHYVGHAEGSKPALTARENLEFWRVMLALPGVAPPMDALEALGRLGVAQTADLPFGYLSAGQKRRVGLARLLLAPRPLWLLDEPLTALDAAGQSLVSELMRDHLAAGGLVVAATHAPLGLPALRLDIGAAA